MPKIEVETCRSVFPDVAQPDAAATIDRSFVASSPIRLDRAIEVAEHKVKRLYNQKQKRRFARAMIADLLDGLDDQDIDAYGNGYRAALSDIR